MRNLLFVITFRTESNLFDRSHGHIPSSSRLLLRIHEPACSKNADVPVFSLRSLLRSKQRRSWMRGEVDPKFHIDLPLEKKLSFGKFPMRVDGLPAMLLMHEIPFDTYKASCVQSYTMILYRSIDLQTFQPSNLLFLDNTLKEIFLRFNPRHPACKIRKREPVIANNDCGD